MLFLLDKKIINANTRVKSATLDQNNVPNPSSGVHSNAELIAINVSGKIEIIAMIMSPTIYLEI